MFRPLTRWLSGNRPSRPRPRPRFRVEALEARLNPSPVAISDAYTTRTGTSLTVPASGVLANDYDNGFYSYPYYYYGLTSYKTSEPTHGYAYLNSDGSFSYTPYTGFSGTDSFTYYAVTTVYNAYYGFYEYYYSTPATVTVTVRPADTVFTLDTQGYLWEHDNGFDPGIAPDVSDAHWRKLSSATFNSIASTTDPSNGLPVVFALMKGTNQIWEHNLRYDPYADPGAIDTHWRRLSTGRFSAIAATADSNAYWGSSGYPYYYGNYGSPAVYGVLNDGTIWLHDLKFEPYADPGATNVHWRQLTKTYYASATTLAATTDYGNPVVYAIMSDGLLWEHNPSRFDSWLDTGATDAHWRLLSTGKFSAISATTDFGTPVVFGLLTSGTLWQHDLNFDPQIGADATDRHWKQMASTGFTAISATTGADGTPVVFGLQTDGRLWEHNLRYDPYADPGAIDTHWRQLSSAKFTSIGAGRSSGPAVAGTTAGGGLWLHELEFDPYADPGATDSHWRKISSGVFTAISSPTR